MAKVTINKDDAPSQELVRDAKAPVTIPDGRGRQITLTKPGVLAQFRLVKMLGETAQNQTYMSMVFPLLFVTAIDGDAVFFPKSELELEALIQRLDDDGVAAVMNGVQEHFGAADQEAAAEAVKP